MAESTTVPTAEQSGGRIYLDNAATSWPKPPAVVAAIADFYTAVGSPAGRGNPTSEFSSDGIVQKCRSELREFIGGGPDDQIVFAFNGTDAINISLFGFLNHGDHVVTTSIEHNSVMRPLEMMRQSHELKITVVQCDADGTVSPGDIRDAIQPNTKMVIFSHASNVTGIIQDAQTIGALCRERKIAFMLDAAQTVGQLPIDVSKIGCDMLAAPGHKGLLGPLGTGFLYIAERVAEQVRPWRAGGTGTKSELSTQPTEYPARLESGNMNVGGLAGLRAGLEFVKSVGVAAIQQHEQQLVSRIVERLENEPRIKLYCATGLNRVGVLSLNIDQFDPREAVLILDSSFGIQVRAGFHCAPGMHHSLGTFELGGTIRISPGWFSTETEIDRLADAITEIANV